MFKPEITGIQIVDLFYTNDLPLETQNIAKPFRDLAIFMLENAPLNPDLRDALGLLLQARNHAVMAKLDSTSANQIRAMN